MTATATAAAAHQLHDELEMLALALAPFTGLDSQPHILNGAVEATIAQLGQEDDDQLAAEACLSVTGALWPRCAPEDCGLADWWRTPLGRLCARSLGRDDAEAVTHSVAAAMLGVTRGTIAQLVHRGTLDRHPDGGVLRASVLQRLSR